MDPELLPGTPAWDSLIRDLERARADLFVLNELPFGAWLATRERFDREAWKLSVEHHEAGIAALAELPVPVVIGSRAVERDGRRCNEAFVWTPEAGAVAVHTKQHIPDSPGYRETTWTEPGQLAFQVAQAGTLRVGVLICTDIIFPEHGRRYGREGADLIAVPRAMPATVSHFFDVALKMNAIVSGCYVASSNRGGVDSAGETYEGRGCIVDPAGHTVAQTSAFDRVVVHELNTDFVAWKKSIYPCDVE
jgi:N-carbamoylputrescine amidase